ncbi:hypothetical protein [Streptomyces albogriseolus]|uniref:hypothetical protein n=1 Tax=Streptomyces albogriseolus TaxID=1887 RepID=UPI0036F74A6C
MVRVAGDDVAYALDRHGRVWAWGRGAGGALGDGDRSQHASAKPVRVSGLPGIRRVAAFRTAGGWPGGGQWQEAARTRRPPAATVARGTWRNPLARSPAARRR